MRSIEQETVDFWNGLRHPFDVGLGLPLRTSDFTPAAANTHIVE
jgi:hypothetical protein